MVLSLLQGHPGEMRLSICNNVAFHVLIFTTEEIHLFFPYFLLYRFSYKCIFTLSDLYLREINVFLNASET